MRRKIKLKKPIRMMSYQERLHGYERDKEELLRHSAGLSPEEFDRRQKAIIKKWQL